MVGMLVGVKHRVDDTDLLAQQLAAKVRRRVD
jgi:hypothetical protein